MLCLFYGSRFAGKSLLSKGLAVFCGLSQFDGCSIVPVFWNGESTCFSGEMSAEPLRGAGFDDW